MERGPLPPHERTWRHPSELAAEERAVLRSEAAAPTTRVFALTTGTLGLLAVGVLILTVTPRRQESPIAISATTTPVELSSPAPRVDALAGALSPAFVPLPSTTATDRSQRAVAAALATPVGDGRIAIATRVALAASDGTAVAVLLPSGRHALGQIVATSGDTVIVALAEAEPGHAIAQRRPRAHDIVTVMATPPITVAFADVRTLDVDEGTPVLDGDGGLVGVCSEGHGTDQVRLIEVTPELAGATSADR